MDIPSGVMPYGDYGLRSSHHFGCLGIRVPACRTEWEELRCVGEVHDAARGSVAGFTEQDVADVFRGDQDRVGLKFFNVFSKADCVAREFVNREDIDIVECSDGGIGGRGGQDTYAAGVAARGQVREPD